MFVTTRCLSNHSRARGDNFRGARFLEQVRGAGDDFQPAFALHHLVGRLVEGQNFRIMTTDDQQRGGRDLRQRIAGKLRPAAGARTQPGQATSSFSLGSCGGRRALAPANLRHAMTPVSVFDSRSGPGMVDSISTLSWSENIRSCTQRRNK